MVKYNADNTSYNDHTTPAPGFFDVTTSYPLSAATDVTDYRRISTTDRTLTTLYLLISGVGLLGNLFVIVVVFHYTAMRKSFTNLFIINQSLVDFVSSIVLLLSTIFEDDGTLLYGVGGDIYCLFWLTKVLLWGSLTSSTFNLLAMTLERYFAIVWPLKHKLSVSQDKILVCIALAWVIGLSFNGAILWPSTKVVNHKCNVLRFWPSVVAQRVTGLLNIAVKFIFPLIILSYCYLHMAIALKTKVQPVVSGTGQTPDASAIGASIKKDKARRNIFKTLMIVTVCFVVCWVWNQVYFIIFNFGYPLNFTNKFYHFTVVAVYFNSCCNPFIYIINYRQFQDGIRKLMGRIRALTGRGTVSSVSSSD